MRLLPAYRVEDVPDRPGAIGSRRASPEGSGPPAVLTPAYVQRKNSVEARV